MAHSPAKCDSSYVIPEGVALGCIGILFLILCIASFLYLSKRSELIALYADPRNKIVTFLRPEDFSAEGNSQKGSERKSNSTRRRRPSHRDVLAEAKRIEEGRVSEDSIPRRNSLDNIAAAQGSVIMAKTADPTNPANSIKYEWEIPFSEIKLHSRIGTGQFGEVYTGEWLDTNVAVKCPRSNLSKEELALFLREVKIMSKIHHPNIVLFLGACLIQPNICLVMEYLTGGNLYDYLNSPPPPPVNNSEPNTTTIIEESENFQDSDNSSSKASKVSSTPTIKLIQPVVGLEDGTAGRKMNEDEIDFFESIRFAIDIARGMKYLHDRAKVVQRDLKSKNLLIDSTMTLKICDFGLSKLEGRSSAHGSSTKELGTPYWLAPEVIRKEQSGTKADVYSFAIVLWEIFTHQIPHKEMTGLEVAYAVAHKGLRPTIKSGTPPVIASLIRRCWKSNPSHRPDFSEILDLLLNESTRMECGGDYNDGSRVYSDGKGGKMPLTSPLASYMRGRGTGGSFFGMSSSGSSTPTGGSKGTGFGMDAEEMKKIQAARKSGRRASLGSIGTKTAREMEAERKGGSLEYPTKPPLSYDGYSNSVVGGGGGSRGGSRIFGDLAGSEVREKAAKLATPIIAPSDDTPKVDNKKKVSGDKGMKTAKVAPV